MTRTPSTATLAERAVIHANAARAGHRPSRHKAREAQKLVGLALLIENRRKGFSYSRQTEKALRP